MDLDIKQYHLDKLLSLSFFIGLICVTQILISAIIRIYKSIIRKPVDLRKRYCVDENSWAVITGGSDGIGLAFCNELAAQSFNICIISRNKTKIDEKLNEIKEKYPKIQTRCVVADFSKYYTYRQYEQLVNEISDLDIALFIINAGWVQQGPYNDLPNWMIDQIVTVNTFQPVYISRALIPLLLKRTKKCGLIFVSSATAKFLFPGTVAYSMSKRVSSFLCQCLRFEIPKDKLDLLLYEPAGVTTQIVKIKAYPIIITAKEAAQTCLNDMGHESYTQGSLSHVFQISMMQLFGKILYPLTYFYGCWEFKRYKVSQGQVTPK